MRQKRLIVPPQCLGGDVAELTGDVLHHVRRVLRLRVGSRLILVDGAGQSREGTIVALSPRVALVEVGPLTTTPPDRAPRITLVHGIARGARTEWVLQKATELGAGRIIPAVCQRSVARPNDLERKRERWLAVIAQAARQCARSRLPELSPALGLADALRAASSAEVRLIADLDADRGLVEFHDQLARPPAEVALAVGPEGGFTSDELTAAISSGFATVRLGSRALRTETAALALLAVVAHLCGKL